jgi:HAD superfamily hydrolase (TIGR01484 family)
MYKFLLALDIDGTITEQNHRIDPKMVDYLHLLYKQGACLGFFTGRFFPFAKAQISHFPFPFFVASQNGAQIFSMPDEKNLVNFYLSKDLVMMIDHISQDFKEDFIVYTDQKTDYKTYYREGKFTKELLDHIKALESTSFHPFIKIDCFSSLPAKAFPCLKNFGKYEETKPLFDKIKALPVAQSLICDPTSDIYTMNLVTHLSATKGEAIKNILNILQQDLPVIAAGNDNNDLPLLKAANIAISVGKNCPQALKEAANLNADCSGVALISYLEHARQMLGV